MTEQRLTKSQWRELAKIKQEINRQNMELGDLYEGLGEDELAKESRSLCTTEPKALSTFPAMRV